MMFVLYHLYLCIMLEIMVIMEQTCFQANVLMRQNELSKAEIYVMRVLSHYPSHLEALRAAASIAGATKRYKEVGL